MRDKIVAERGMSAYVSTVEWEAVCTELSIKHGVSAGLLLSTKKKTVYSRLRRGNVSGEKVSSPVAKMEPILVEMVIMRARMRQPMSPREGKAFANSLLENYSMGQ